MVSCVPGSPIDCAARIPMAWPISTRLTVRQVTPVAGRTDAMFGLTGQYTANLRMGDACLLNDLNPFFIDLNAGWNQYFIGERIEDIFNGQAAQEHALPDVE
jgi:hypothetical protein